MKEIVVCLLASDLSVKNAFSAKGQPPPRRKVMIVGFPLASGRLSSAEEGALEPISGVVETGIGAGTGAIHDFHVGGSS